MPCGMCLFLLSLFVKSFYCFDDDNDFMAMDEEAWRQVQVHAVPPSPTHPAGRALPLHVEGPACPPIHRGGLPLPTTTTAHHHHLLQGREVARRPPPHNTATPATRIILHLPSSQWEVKAGKGGRKAKVQVRQCEAEWHKGARWGVCPETRH